MCPLIDHYSSTRTDRPFFCSLKLIQGDIDQVDAKAHITWVQPRVLSRQQIEGLAGNLTAWVDKMAKLQEYVDKEQVPVL